MNFSTFLMTYLELGMPAMTDGWKCDEEGKGVAGLDQARSTVFSFINLESVQEMFPHVITRTTKVELELVMAPKCCR